MPDEEPTQGAGGEFRVHQVQLEMQNDELRRVYAEAESSQERYRELYEFAPVGYATLDEAGLIIQLNLKAASPLSPGALAPPTAPPCR